MQGNPLETGSNNHCARTRASRSVHALTICIDSVQIPFPSRQGRDTATERRKGKIEKRSNALPLCLPLDTGMRVDHERGICLPFSTISQGVALFAF